MFAVQVIKILNLCCKFSMQTGKETIQIIMSFIGKCLTCLGKHPRFQLAEFEKVFMIRCMRFSGFSNPCTDKFFRRRLEQILFIQHRISNRSYRTDCANRVQFVSIEEHFSLTEWDFLILFGMLGGALVLGIIIMGHLSDHLMKRRPFIVAGLIGFGALAFILVANAENFEQLWSVWPLLPTLGFIAGAFPPAAMAYGAWRSCLFRLRIVVARWAHCPRTRPAFSFTGSNSSQPEQVAIKTNLAKIGIALPRRRNHPRPVGCSEIHGPSK